MCFFFKHFWRRGVFFATSYFSIFSERLPSTLAVYPLDRKRKGKDISGSRNPSADFNSVGYNEGPDGRRFGSVEFSGQSNSYAIIPNNGKLDARYSITVLVHLFYQGGSGPFFNYNPEKKGLLLRMISATKLEVEIIDRKRRTSIKVKTPGRVFQREAWNYIGMTYSERRQLVSIWVNLKLVATKRVGKVELDTGHPIRLSGYKNSRGYFRGRLFCLQLYSVALTGEKIKEAMKKCFLKGKRERLVWSICFSLINSFCQSASIFPTKCVYVINGNLNVFSSLKFHLCYNAQSKAKTCSLLIGYSGKNFIATKNNHALFILL